MAELKEGDRVRMKNRPDWPTPPGYRWAKREGTVTKVWLPDWKPEPAMFKDFIEVQLDKGPEIDSCWAVFSDGAGAGSNNVLTLRGDAVEKI